MKRCVKRWSQIPHGAMWRAKYPPTDRVFTGRNYDALMADAKGYFTANNLPIGLAFEDNVEDWLCETMPQECVDCDDGRKKVRRPHKLSMAAVVRGTKTMLSHWWNGRQLVDDAEAKRRADICRHCPENIVFQKPCGGICGELQEIVNTFAGIKNNAYSEGLESCRICGCFNSAAIWVPRDIQTAALSQELKDAFKQVPGCWKAD